MGTFVRAFLGSPLGIWQSAFGIYHPPMPQMTVEQAMQWADQLRTEKRPADAVTVCQQVLAAHPSNLFVMNRLGIALGDAGRMADARATFEQVLARDPSFCDAWANLSLAAEKMDDLDLAISARQKALDLRPEIAESWHRLGACFGKRKDYKPAIDAIRKAIELGPTDQGVHHDLIMALCGHRQLDDAAEILFSRIKQTGKAKSETVRILADVYKFDGRFEEATEIWRKTLALDPQCHEASGQLAMCLITLGHYKEGWELYETRWNCDSFADNTRRDVNRQWGHDLVGHPDVSGKTILLYSEQGIGDTIQFVRYAAIFAERGARVIVQCPWPVKSLLEKCDGVRLAYSLTDPLPKYDWHVPLLSLPHAFGTTFETIPTKIPYLKVDDSRRKSWRARLETASPAGTKLRAGLAWAGNPKHKNDVNRSIHPKFFEPLAQFESINYFTLQKSNENEKAAIRCERPKLIDFTGYLCDFAETAALVEQLDLIICADTAIAHLAGALGKEVWLMCPFVPDFRWGLHGERTPWYPSIRIFRQKKPQDWDGVMTEVVAAMQKRLVRH
jgi:tetratricopeptide (TPR) repeat protein